MRTTSATNRSEFDFQEYRKLMMLHIEQLRHKKKERQHHKQRYQIGAKERDFVMSKMINYLRMANHK